MSSKLQPNLVALNTIVYREVRRFTRIWPQTLLPPAITMVLYFVIFGNLIGRQIGDMGGFTYMEYIVPGLIMMSVITNSYGNVVSSFFGSKFQRSIEELMVSPVSPHTILIGYTLGGVLRGLMVGIIVTLLSLFFTDLQVHHLGVTILVVVLTATIFSLLGFINAVFARNFDDVSRSSRRSWLTPLTYLGGVFYSISLLPPFWQTVSLANPVLHMVNAFRYAHPRRFGYQDQHRDHLHAGGDDCAVRRLCAIAGQWARDAYLIKTAVRPLRASPLHGRSSVRHRSDVGAGLPTMCRYRHSNKKRPPTLEEVVLHSYILFFLRRFHCRATHQRQYIMVRK